MEYPNLGQGIRNPRIERPITSREQLQGMTSKQTMHAFNTGQLDELVGRDSENDQE